MATRTLGMVAALALAGCAPARPQVSEDALQAFYPEYPALFVTNFAANCTDPQDRLSRIDADTFVCESLPDPETAAALILQFDGRVDALPTFVSVVETQEVANGYVVTADAFIRVPGRDGRVIQFRPLEAELRDRLTEAYRATGGAPL